MKAQFRRHAADPEYGHICPTCAGPKDRQSSRCRACWVELLRTRWASRPARLESA